MAYSNFPDILQDTNNSLIDQEECNIVLLGETGVGKSTFINSFANYLQCDQLGGAIRQEPRCLIPISFTIPDENYDLKGVKFGDNEDENEVHVTGQSATQQCKSFVFPYRGCRVRLIDTPGIGDTRGIKQDKENFENILNCIAHFDYINCFCILLKPNMSRLNITFEYCIKQLLSHINKQACHNIVFVFTNTRSTFYRFGDTGPIVKNVLGNITKIQNEVKIEFSKQTIYCLDNEAFRFLIAKKTGIEFTQDEIESFDKSWTISHDECSRLMSYIIGQLPEQLPLAPHPTRNTLSVNETRIHINMLSKVMGQIMDLIIVNLIAIKMYKEDIKSNEKNIQALKDNLFIPRSEIESTKLVQPRMVCTSDRCSALYDIYGVTRTLYPTHCHARCTCKMKGVCPDQTGDKSLKRCSAFSWLSKKCKHCQCSYKQHMYVLYETKIVPKLSVDEDRQSRLRNLNDSTKLAQNMIDDAESITRELKREQSTILQIQALFANYLNQNAILPHNDAFKSYIEHQIENEMMRSITYSNKGNNARELEQLLKDYEDVKILLNESKLNEHKYVIYEQEIFDNIDRLYKLKHFGKKLQELKESQEYESKVQFSFMEKVVDSNNIGVFSRQTSITSNSYSTRVQENSYLKPNIPRKPSNIEYKTNNLGQIRQQNVKYNTSHYAFPQKLYRQSRSYDETSPNPGNFGDVLNELSEVFNKRLFPIGSSPEHNKPGGFIESIYMNYQANPEFPPPLPVKTYKLNQRYEKKSL